MGSGSSNQLEEIEQLKRELLLYRSYDSFIEKTVIYSAYLTFRGRLIHLARVS